MRPYCKLTAIFLPQFLQFAGLNLLDLLRKECRKNCEELSFRLHMSFMTLCALYFYNILTCSSKKKKKNTVKHPKIVLVCVDDSFKNLIKSVKEQEQY